jgi:hypothetical protein
VRHVSVIDMRTLTLAARPDSDVTSGCRGREDALYEDAAARRMRSPNLRMCLIHRICDRFRRRRRLDGSELWRLDEPYRKIATTA